MKKRVSIRIKLLCVAITLVMLISCVSCGIKISASELSSGYSRKATETGEITDEFISAIADFSFELFGGLVTNDSENDLISPLSAVICLAMIANGAAGETKAQLEAAFGMDIENLNKALYAYTGSLYSSDKCKLNLADSIWFRDNGSLHLNEEFLQDNADWYDAQVYGAPFDNSTVKDINNWCKKHTDGMIDEIIKEISSYTIMYLINALSFDAKWENKYEKKDIKDREFTNYGGEKNTVKMMYSVESSYISGDGVKGFTKNYSGIGYSFVGLLPDVETDIYDFIGSLNGEKWLSLWKNRSDASVSVGIPEFTYSTKMKLNDVLQSMGVTDMFDGSAADFSRLGTSDDGKIYCSSVEQKTFIQVDRNGTKAAAITWGEMKNTSAPIDENIVILDRSFVYAIVDNSTGLPMFVGAVTSIVN